MKKILIPLLLVVMTGCASANVNRAPARDHTEQTKITLTGSLEPNEMPFVSHTGPGAFDNALALNVPNDPIKGLRGSIEQVIGRRLDYLKSWDPNGEAHVTTITPPEFANVLGKLLSMREIDAIATSNGIQKSDLLILGIGSGKKEIKGSIEETFFVIVDSQKLRQIRHEIWKLFVKKGGDPKSWDPSWFFPHVTIGYTKQDLHEPDVVKNVRSSWDKRFQLIQ